MKNSIRPLLLGVVVITAMVFQSCDSTLTMDEPSQFYKYIGTDGDQWAVDLVTTSQDTVYILGRSTSTSDGLQLYVIKTNPKGIVLWEKKFGGPGDDDPKDIELLNNGNLIVAADRTDLTGKQEIVIYTLNSADGSIIGTPKVDGLPGVANHVNSITQVSDGYIVAAHTDNGSFKEALVIRYDATFNRYPGWGITYSSLGAVGGQDVVPIKVIQVSTSLFYTFGYTAATITGDNTPDYNFFVYVSGDINTPGLNTLFIPGPSGTSNERLTSVWQAPPEAGSGFVMAGYVSDPGSSEQQLYVVKVRQTLVGIAPSDVNAFMERAPRVISSSLSPITDSKACIFPSKKSSGYFVLGNENLQGNENIFLTKIGNNLTDAWDSPNVYRSFGGAGNDMSGAVVETSTGRILLCGTMVLGDVIGQKKVVLINLSPNGLFGE